MSAQLLLIGGGHAHLGVLGILAKRQLQGIDVTLVSQHDDQLYSGMMPGYLAGHYSLPECSIPLDPVAEAAHADFIRARITGIDLKQRIAITDQGAPIPFDVVSIDIGPAPDLTTIGGLEHALPVRPMNQLLEAWRTLEMRFAGTPLTQTLAVLGGGPAGTEVVLGLAQRARQADLQLKLTLITGRAGLLPTLPEAARERMRRRLLAMNVRVLEVDAQSIGANSVLIRSAGDYHADVIIAALPTAAAGWPRQAGLKCDRAGFIEVNQHLQSVSHPFVFAAGDCASMSGNPYPKSGVYAVRAGPPLATNLLRFLTKRSLTRYRPQKRALYLLSTGEQYAVGVWGAFTFEGEWVWRWKDRIDRKFIRRFNPRV